MIKYLKDTDLTDMLAEEAFSIDDKIRDRFAWGHGEFESENQVTWKLGNILRQESSDTFEVTDSDGNLYYEGDNCFYGWFLDSPAGFISINEMFFFKNLDKKVVHRTERFNIDFSGYSFQLDSYDVD